MRLIAAAALMLAATIVSVNARRSEQIPQSFTNLQVLPKDMSRAALVELMRSFAMGLGVRCEHCHVGEGNDLSKFDFASDDRPAKKTARTMIKMAAMVNNELLKGIGDAGRQPKVTCFTCHRGEKTPAIARPPGAPSAF